MHTHYKARPIMFWRSNDRRDRLEDRRGGRLLPDPRACVRADIPRARREWAARVLAAGKVGISYMGWADCRICGATLGTSDRLAYGFVWPEKAEHYVLEHDVWVPELDELLTIASAAVAADFERDFPPRK